MKKPLQLGIGIALGIGLVALPIFVISQINKRAYLAELAEADRKQNEWNREIEEVKRKQRLLIEDAIANRKVIEGMSTHDVMRAVGYPDSKQSEISGDNRIETWVKGNLIISFIDWGGTGKPKVVSVKTMQ